MAIAILTVDNFFKREDMIALGGGLMDRNLKADWLKDLKGKNVAVIRDKKDRFEVAILDVQISYSLASFKNIFLMVSHDDANKLAVGDVICID